MTENTDGMLIKAGADEDSVIEINGRKEISARNFFGILDPYFQLNDQIFAYESHQKLS